MFILRNILPTTCFSSISSCSNSYNYFYVIVVIVLLQVHRRQNREDCLIDVQTERFCATCRLMKCLMVEMRLDNTISEDIIRGKQSAAVVKEGNMVVGIKFHTKPLITFCVVPHYSCYIFLATIDYLSRHSTGIYFPMSHTLSTSSVQHLSFDIAQILILFTEFYTSIESFISSSADFQTLTLAEKHSLYHRNLHGVLNLYATFILSIFGMFDTRSNTKILVSVYGQDIYQQIKQISSR